MPGVRVGTNTDYKLVNNERERSSARWGHHVHIHKSVFFFVASLGNIAKYYLMIMKKVLSWLS